MDSLKQKFTVIHRKQMLTGDTTMTEAIGCKKDIRYKIKERSGLQNGKEETADDYFNESKKKIYII